MLRLYVHCLSCHSPHKHVRLWLLPRPKSFPDFFKYSHVLQDSRLSQHCWWSYIAPLEEQCHNSKNAHFELCPQEVCLRPYLPSGIASHVYFLKWPRDGIVVLLVGLGCPGQWFFLFWIVVLFELWQCSSGVRYVFWFVTPHRLLNRYRPLEPSCRLCPWTILNTDATFLSETSVTFITVWLFRISFAPVTPVP
jgi:hypothetical protein